MKPVDRVGVARGRLNVAAGQQRESLSISRMSVSSS